MNAFAVELKDALNRRLEKLLNGGERYVQSFFRILQSSNFGELPRPRLFGHLTADAREAWARKAAVFILQSSGKAVGV